MFTANARARERVLYIATRQLAVLVELGYIEIYSVVRFVPVALFAQSFDKVNHFVDIVCRFGYNFGFEYVEPFQSP